MNLLDKIKWYLDGRPCLHANRDLIQYIDDDTPMLAKICLDCDEILEDGYVHGDTYDWVKVWPTRNGNQLDAREIKITDYLRLASHGLWQHVKPVK
jgi:hypothetical protein